MKVLHINCNYTGNHVHRTMIKHLSKFGLDNYVFSPVYKCNNDFKDDKKVIVLKCFNKWDRIFFDYKSRKIRLSVINKYNLSEIDLVHAYTLFTDGNVAYKLKKLYNIPYVVAVRNTDVNTFMKYMIHLRKRGIKIMQEASAIFFLSNSYKRGVFDKYIPKKLWKELEKKVHIIPNGVDDFWLAECNTEKKDIKLSEQINVIYAGRIDKNKNIETTQKALNILREKGYKISFSVVGKIDNKKVFNKIIKYSNTYYYENKSKNELKELYRKSDIFVMPSFKETFGLVYVEAMSQGLPVIYTRNQGFDEQFEEGIVGYSVDPKNSDEIAKKILIVLQNYEYLSNNCIKMVKKFKWQTIGGKYNEIYARIAHKNY